LSIAKGGAQRQQPVFIGIVVNNFNFNFNGSGLANGRIMEADVVPLAEVLLRDNARSAALYHIWGMSSPDVDPAGVAILID
jgi:hypothetical protein